MGEAGLVIAILVIGSIVIIVGLVAVVAVYAMNRPADDQPHAREIFHELCSVVKAVIDLLVRRRR